MNAAASNLIDRAAGVLLATACGDALGAGYERFPPLADDVPIAMVGRGSFAPGEWTDDTSTADTVAEAAAKRLDLRTGDGLDDVAEGFLRWYADGHKGIGRQTRAVLRASQTGGSLAMTAAARAYVKRNPHHSAGNGALMRTAAVALAYLDDPDGLIAAARAVSDLTHADATSGEACALWSFAIRYAVLYGTFDGLREGLAHLPGDRADHWAKLLDEAESKPPSAFDRNRWVEQALQGAWSAIVRTPVPLDDPGSGSFAAQHVQLALEAAVRGGGDTDTVAAIAGGLLGARWGVSAVPPLWRSEVHGWPGYRARDLVRLAVHAARRSLGHPADDLAGWPSVSRIDYHGWHPHDHVVAHPHDPLVLLGSVRALHRLPDGVDAVVSLCRLGVDETPPSVQPRDHIEVRLVDAGPAENPHLSFVIDSAARAVAALRQEGRTVLLHCVGGRSRTPIVAARYSVLANGIDSAVALDEVIDVLPETDVNAELRSHFLRLGRYPTAAASPIN